MTGDESDEGYPTSPPEDTTPMEDPISLDEADELRAREHEVAPEGAKPDGTAEQEDEDEEINDVEGTGLIQSTPVVPDADV